MMKKLIAILLALSMLMSASCAIVPQKEQQGGEQASSGVEEDSSAEKEAEKKKQEEEQKKKEEEERKQKEEEARQERINAIESMLEDPYLVLVNRDHKLSSDFEPEDLVTFEGGCPIDRTCAAQLEKLIDAGEEAGYKYVLYSGYRTYTRQYNIYYNKVNRYKNQGYSEEEAIRLANRYNAPPGASEHQTGLAADVCIPSIINKYGELHDAYGETEEFEWFSAHAHEYGFIMRYQKGKEDITGYAYEPWHYRYVGVAVAKEIHQLGITYEEYVQKLQTELETLKNA